VPNRCTPVAVHVSHEPGYISQGLENHEPPQELLEDIEQVKKLGKVQSQPVALPHKEAKAFLLGEISRLARQQYHLDDELRGLEESIKHHADARRRRF